MAQRQATTPFVWGANGEKLTPNDVKRNRRVASALFNKRRVPQNVAEGLVSIGDALLYNSLTAKADKAERAGRETIGSKFNTYDFGGNSKDRAVAAALTENSTKQSSSNDVVDALIGGDSDTPTDYNTGLAKSESNGRYDVVNSEGYTGKYQFGEARLADYNKAAGQNISMEAFRASPEAQEAAQKWNVSDTDSFIENNELSQYAGQNVGGVDITQNSMRAMAHLGGQTGMKKYLQSGGQYNPADSNGTHLSDYGRSHAGQLTTVAQALRPTPNAGGISPQIVEALQGVAEQSQQPSSPTGMDPELMKMFANPWASPEQRTIMQMKLKQQMQSGDPLRQLQIQEAQRGAARAPINNRIKDQAALNADRAADQTYNTNANKGPDLKTIYDEKTGRKVNVKWDKNQNKYVPVGGVAAAKTGIHLDEDGNLVQASGPTKKVTGDLQKDLINAEKSMLSIQTIKKRYNDQYLAYSGDLRAGYARYAEKLGISLTDAQKAFLKGRTKFRQMVQQEFNTYRKEITGAAAAVQELSDLKKSMMNTELSPTEFEGAVEVYQEATMRMLRLKRKFLREGLSVSDRGFGDQFDDAWLGGSDDTVEDRTNELRTKGMQDTQIQQALINEGYIRPEEVQASPSSSPQSAPQRAINPQTGQALELQNGQWVPAR